MQGIKTIGARNTAANASPGVVTSSVPTQCGGGFLTPADDGRDGSAIAGLPRKSNCSLSAKTEASAVQTPLASLHVPFLHWQTPYTVPVHSWFSPAHGDAPAKQSLAVINVATFRQRRIANAH